VNFDMAWVFAALKSVGVGGIAIGGGTRDIAEYLPNFRFCITFSRSYLTYSNQLAIVYSYVINYLPLPRISYF
jgi:hypothetical protein